MIGCAITFVAARGQAEASPKAAVEELLATDRAFAAASAKADTVSGLSAMFDDKVVMLAPKVNFTASKAQAIAALRGNPANAVSKTEWTPIRGGVSADGQHGFTVGYLTTREDGKPDRPGKYVAYWVKRPAGWRVAVYKRAGRPAGDVPLATLEPALPVRQVPISSDAAAIAGHRKTLDQAERSFSDEAQKIGIGPAFAKYGSADAMNVGGEAAFTIGAENIARGIASNEPGSPVSWGPTDVLVASSGDLGITWGLIRTNRPPPEGQPAEFPYLTVWRRARMSDPWRYVAE